MVVLGFTADLLEDRIERVEETLGERDGACESPVVERELEPALAALEANELAYFANPKWQHRAGADAVQGSLARLAIQRGGGRPQRSWRLWKSSNLGMSALLIVARPEPRPTIFGRHLPQALILTCGQIGQPKPEYAQCRLL
jgi:hypothetical protein